MGAKVVVVRARELDWNLENSLKLTKIFGNKPTYKGLKRRSGLSLLPCSNPVTSLPIRD